MTNHLSDGSLLRLKACYYPIAKHLSAKYGSPASLHFTHSLGRSSGERVWRMKRRRLATCPLKASPFTHATYGWTSLHVLLVPSVRVHVDGAPERVPLRSFSLLFFRELFRFLDKPFPAEYCLPTILIPHILSGFWLVQKKTKAGCSLFFHLFFHNFKRNTQPWTRSAVENGALSQLGSAPRVCNSE